MAQQLHSNNAISTLALSATDSDTLLGVEAGDGTLFAAPTDGDWQMLTLTDTDTGALEVVKATARSTDTLTVTRAQEGTAAVAWAAGAKIEARLTAGMLDKLQGRAVGTLAVALGGASAAGYGGAALGDLAAAAGASAVAIGSGATAAGANSTAVGAAAAAQGASSIALGYLAVAHRPHQLAATAHACVPRPGGEFIPASHSNAGAESMWGSVFMELGAPAAWVASTVYVDGAVVQPTTPNGLQYRLAMDAFDPAATNSITSGASEPAWSVMPFGYGLEAGATWIAADLSAGVDMATPAGMVFYPSEVGFVCFNYSDVTAAPFVSVGTTADSTLLVNNQQLTGITGANQAHRFTAMPANGIADLRIKLVTPATGASARFHGRFYIKGFFIQTQG